jgi:S-adenosylmethionine hydrolase
MLKNKMFKIYKSNFHDLEKAKYMFDDWVTCLKITQEDKDITKKVMMLDSNGNVISGLVNEETQIYGIDLSLTESHVNCDFCRFEVYSNIDIRINVTKQ